MQSANDNGFFARKHLLPIGNLFPSAKNVYLQTLRDGQSRDTTERKLGHICRLISGAQTTSADAFPWHTITFAVVLSVRDYYITKRASVNTTNTILNVLKGISRICWKLGTMPEAQYRLIDEVPSAKGTPKPAGRSVSHNELDELLIAAREHTTGKTYFTVLGIIAFCYGCGFRIAEALSLTRDDIEYADGLPRFVGVIGKGGKARKVPIPSMVAGHIVSFINSRVARDALDEVETTWLFPGRTKEGPMVPGGVRELLKKLAVIKKLKSLSPHDLRRSYISDLLDNGADIATVAQLVGHSSVNTTMRYDRRPERARVETVEKLPGFGRGRKHAAK